MQPQWTISQPNCDVQWNVDIIWQLAMTRLVVGLRRNSKSLPKATLAPKKSWSLFGGLLPASSPTAFWIPTKPLPLRSMVRKLRRCTEICNTCGQHRLLERAQFSTETPDCTAHNQFFKSWTNQAKMFSLICRIYLISCQLTTTSSSISTIFFQGKASTTSSRQKCFPRVHWITRYGIFTLQE